MRRFILLAIMTPTLGYAATPRECLTRLGRSFKELGFQVYDHTYALAFPYDDRPRSIREAKRSSRAMVDREIAAFARMPHDRAKFLYALDALERHGIRAYGLGPFVNLSVLHQHQSRALMKLIPVYQRFVEHAIFRHYGLYGGEPLVDFELISFEDGDEVYARAVLERVRLANARVISGLEQRLSRAR